MKIQPLQELSIEAIKEELLSRAIRGERLNHQGRCLFSGFAVNQALLPRIQMLQKRLETLLVPGAVFEIQTKTSTAWETFASYKVAA